jgi:hypothetical protein
MSKYFSNLNIFLEIPKFLPNFCYPIYNNYLKDFLMKKRRHKPIPKEEMTEREKRRAKRRRITWRLDVLNIFGEKIATQYVAPDGTFVTFNHNEKRMKEVDIYPIFKGIQRLQTENKE